MDVYQLTFLRFMIGGLVLLPFAVKEMHEMRKYPSWRDLIILLLLGTLCIPVAMVLLQLGIEYSNASTASVLFSMNPLIVLIFAHFIANEKMTKNKAMLCSLAIVGGFFIMRPWDIQTGNSIKGMIFIGTAIITFAVYTVLSKKSVAKYGAMTQCSISFILGSCILLCILIILRKPVTATVEENLPMILYNGIGIIGLGYYCFFSIMKETDVSTASIIFFIKTGIAPIIAVIVLGEEILWNTVVGIVIILTASFTSLRRNKKSLT